MLGKAFRWLPEYAVGVPEIDREHQGLFALAERLHSAMRAGKGGEFLNPHLDELIEYTRDHFAHEETLMKRIGYPYYEDHCRQHEELRTKVREMGNRAAAGEISMTIEVMQFLLSWLRSHTTTSDRRIGTYMRKCGLVP
jgi:hemerythrin-like metal-binding protein